MSGSEYEPQPSVVVGTGQAGIAVLSSIADLVDREGVREYFHLIAIDSNASELENAPDRADTIHLTYSDDYFDSDREMYSYLQPDMEFTSEGAKRQRPVGRYKLDSRGDNNFANTFVRLSESIRDHVRERVSGTGRRERAFIYFVNSLGGGTGSGTFPLVAASLSKIAEQIYEEQSMPTYTCGVGVIPKLGGIRDVDFPGRPIYFANSYASLRDVETMIEAPSPNDPLSIRVESARHAGTRNRQADDVLSVDKTLELPETPFDKYFLVGVDELRVNDPPGENRMEGHADVVDNTAAEALYALSRYDGIENLLDAPDVGGFRQSEVAVPIDQLRQYCEAKERKREEEAKVAEDGELTLAKDRVSGRIEEIREVVSAPSKVQTVSAVADDAVDTYVRDELDDRFGRGRALIDHATTEDIRDFVTDVGDRYDGKTPGRRALIQLFALYKLKRRLDDAEETAREERADIVSTMWDNHNMVDTKYGDLDIDEDEGAIGAKASAIEPYLEEQIEEYEERVADSGLIPNPFNNDKEYLEYYKEELRTLTNVQRNHEVVKTLQETHREARQSVEARLDEIRTNLSERRRELRDEIESTERTIAELEEDIASLRRDLERPNYEPRLGYLPIKNLDEIDTRRLENELTDLPSFIDLDFIDESEFAAAVGTQIDDAIAAENSILNRTVPEGATAEQENVFWSMFSAEFANSDYSQYLPDAAEHGAEEFSDNPPRIDDPYRVKFVSYRLQEPLRDYDVYRSLDEAATGGRFDGAFKDDRDYLFAFAYQEWYDETDDTFDQTVSVELSVPPELDDQRVDGEFDSEGERKNYNVTSALDSYLWNGAYDADMYDGTGVDFDGWGNILGSDDVGIGWQEFQAATPAGDAKNRWLADRLEWEELLQQLGDNLRSQYNVEVTWQYPEQEPERLLED